MTDEIPEEGFCLESLWPGARLDQRCEREAGHDGLHTTGDGSFMWGALTEVEEIPE